MADLEGYVPPFEQFFTSFYQKEVERVLKDYPKNRSIEVDFKDLLGFDVDLANSLNDSPDDIIKAAETAVERLKIATPSGDAFRPHVRFFGIPDRNILVEQIGSRHLNKFFSFKGLIGRRGDVLNKAHKLVYKCGSCSERFELVVTKDFTPPSKCPICKKGFLKESLDESKFLDLQRIEVQDMLERVRSGSPTSKVICNLEDDLVNKIIPGDNVEVSGILRISPNQGKNKSHTVFSKNVDIVHIRKLKMDFEDIPLTKEDEAEILKLAAREDLEDMMTNSIAPDIWGYREIKKALALQLFGGTKDKITSGGARIRDDIHVLLVGDPGIAKTRFLQQTVAIALKSIYVSGKSVSGVGLTASAEKDELSGEGWTLKAGALVLASGGIAAIDEFDKINDEDRGSLHEVMESGSVSLAKAGIVATLRAKTAIVAAANPKFGRFQQNKHISEQFNIPPSLLSRFDLIFPILDILDVQKDERLADHILGTHLNAMDSREEREGKTEKREDIISTDVLRKYIAYAKKHINPRLTKEATNVIKEFYMSLRGLGARTGSVPITPRYLEGLVRLAEANAKLRLSDTVQERDAKVAVDIMNYVMKAIMTDQETGRIDVDIISTGRSQSEREKIIQVMDIIKELSSQYDAVEVEMIVQEAKGQNIEEGKTRRVIDELMRNGEIYFPKHGFVKVVTRD
jgi:replicative DNA helicase Mcm